jgi:hypothetical protein
MYREMGHGLLAGEGQRRAGEQVTMTPPTSLDSAGRRRPTLACWTCGREVAPMRFRADDLRPHGRRPSQTLQIPDWCGCSTEYLPIPTGDGLVDHGPQLGPWADGKPTAALATGVPYCASDT